MTLPAQADIVERLRKGRLALLGNEIFEAADIIESLTAERDEARAAHDADARAFLSANSRAEAAEARADTLVQEVERLRANLETRDKFIVSKDLWGEFVAQLDEVALGDRP